jgi:hypothetical protein
LAADGHAEDSSAPESRVSAGGPLLDAELANIDRRLWEPPASVVDDLAELPGDLLLLGAGGTLGLSLARMARLAFDQADRAIDRQPGRRVIAISRFAARGSAVQFEEAGVETLAADLSACCASIMPTVRREHGRETEVQRGRAVRKRCAIGLDSTPLV